MNRIVLISGKQGSGKTTMGKLLEERLQRFGVPSGNILITKFAEPLYQLHDAVQVAAFTLGLIPRIQPKDGKLLQLLGTEWIRNTIDPDAWCKYVDRKAKTFFPLGKARPHIVIVDDCRFPNEFDNFPGAYSIRLECHEEIRRARTDSWRDNTEHPSETALDGYSALGRFSVTITTQGDKTSEKFNADLDRICAEILNQPKEG